MAITCPFLLGIEEERLGVWNINYRVIPVCNGDNVRLYNVALLGERTSLLVQGEIVNLSTYLQKNEVERLTSIGCSFIKLCFIFDTDQFIYIRV